ncbi:MAG: glucosaminidase domain-containing protein [Vicingaceae bacterium]
MRRAISMIIFFCLALAAFPQDIWSQPAEYRMSREEYIDKYKDQAIREMLHSGVPASITLAQGILESADGNSPLARYANNHFGIKCHNTWNGETFIMDDDAKNECFRKYNSAYESFRDHSEFLSGRSRYAELFALKITDYEGWAKGLKKAGYATNPKYANILIYIIESHNLDQYDKVSKMPKQEVVSDVAQENRIEVVDRTIDLQNNIKYTVVKPDDSFYKIAQEMNLGLWQLYKYNDMQKGDQLEPGQVLYLQPKRSKGTKDQHLVKKGDTMWQISQKYGIKLKKLYKRNDMKPGSEAEEGNVLYLSKKR